LSPFEYRSAARGGKLVDHHLPYMSREDFEEGEPRLPTELASQGIGLVARGCGGRLRHGDLLGEVRGGGEVPPGYQPRRSLYSITSPRDSIPNRVGTYVILVPFVPVPAVPDLGTLDGGIPAALLLVEPTEQEVHLPMEVPVGVCRRAEALGALAVMDILLRHGPTLRVAVSKSIPAYQERGT